MRIPLLSDLPQPRRDANRARLTALERLPDPGAPLTRVTVVGGAATGLGVALSLTAAGIPVLFFEEDAASMERAQHYLTRLTPVPPPTLTFSTEPADVAPSDLLIDRTIEPLAHKTAELSRLAAHLPADTPLLVNLAGADLSELAAHLPNPSRVIGAQVFTPAATSRIVELAPHPQTDVATLATARRFAAQIGKTPVMATPDGFTSERLQMRLLEAADTLLMDGSTPWEIDEALEAFGYPMGVYEAQDLIGMDVAYAIRQRMARDPARRYIPIADRAVEEGRLGKKASVGWYRYPGGEGKVIDPLVEDLCRIEAHFARVTPRHIPEDDLRERLLLAQINEAALLLSAGVTAADLDLISVHALGFPADWGGVLTCADQLGLSEILDALTTLQAEDAVVWTPAPALVKAALTGRPISPR